ncbi:MAG: EcsC family protein [Almyronema sp.]
MPEQQADLSQSIAEVFVSAQQAGQFTAAFANKALQWIAGNTVDAITAVSDQAEAAAQQSMEQVTEIAGKLVTPIIDNPVLQFISKAPGLGWIGSLGQIDVEQVRTEVDQLKRKYSSENADEIAHRLIVDTAFKAGGVGLVTNIVPPVAVALLAIDLAATTKLQSEMIYRIAYTYGFDLEDPVRKGEVLTIFGLSLGGSGLLKTGFSFAEIIPGVGAVIGASSNLLLLYTLGYAARRFYKAKQNGDLTQQTADAIQQEQTDYVKVAIEQQAIMDQILARIILASYPEQTWSEISQELQKLAISDKSAQAIAANTQSPKPLEVLLPKLDKELALPLIKRCEQIAHQSGKSTPQKEAILSALYTYFDLRPTTSPAGS